MSRRARISRIFGLLSEEARRDAAFVECRQTFATGSYRVASDYNVPYWVTGAQQDSGAVRVRSRGKFASITMRDWEPLCAGGESGYTAPDPRHR